MMSFSQKKRAGKMPVLLLCYLLAGNCSATQVSVSIDQVYVTSDKPQKGSNEEIVNMVSTLVTGVLNKNLSQLPNFVNRNRGIYLDVKGLWSFEELQTELKKEDSIFEIYFFDHNKLVKQKKSPNVLTVRELLIASEGLKLDLFYEDSKSCEVKIKFLKNKKLAYDLNNPYFILIDGKWYLYRLF
ncbi:MAG: hypothetical protein H7A23_07790 [Leptospiraceae bacterium]|nr:hypothetical protein [Leptospiraceae bacterium]MCP5494444.1 hypothetical protein [Leptospiraceae bacterium]